MNEPTFLVLLSLVTPIIEKQDTMMKTAITPHERLPCILRYLATGRSYEDLKFSTFISLTTQTTEKIWSFLPIYHSTPTPTLRSAHKISENSDQLQLQPTSANRGWIGVGGGHTRANLDAVGVVDRCWELEIGVVYGALKR